MTSRVAYIRNLCGSQNIVSTDVDVNILQLKLDACASQSVSQCTTKKIGWNVAIKERKEIFFDITENRKSSLLLNDEIGQLNIKIHSLVLLVSFPAISCRWQNSNIMH